MKIDGFRTTDLAQFDKPAQPAASGGSFLETLQGAINSTNQAAKDAEKAALALASGENTNIHEAMILAQKSSVQMQFLVKATNKLIQGYTELMSVR